MRLTHLRVRYGRTGGALRSAVLSTTWAVISPAPAWRPPCDVVEGAAGWTVRLEIGGVSEEGVEVSLYEDSLVVEGTRPWPGVVAGDRVHLAEVRYGPFRLALELPGGIERDGARASWDRGLLTIVLPKAGARGETP